MLTRAVGRAGLAAGLVAVLVRMPDPVGVYGMIQHIEMEPASRPAERIRVWGVFALADGPKGDGYGVVQRGYFYYACPAGQLTACRNDWSDLRWFEGTSKGVGFGLRTAPVGRLRKESESPASPDPYPVGGGIVKVESKDPAYIDLVARLKAALGLTAPSARPSPTSRGRTSR